jgi:hypothetical protein
MQNGQEEAGDSLGKNRQDKDWIAKDMMDVYRKRQELGKRHAGDRRNEEAGTGTNGEEETGRNEQQEAGDS